MGTSKIKHPTSFQLSVLLDHMMKPFTILPHAIWNEPSLCLCGSHSRLYLPITHVVAGNQINCHTITGLVSRQPLFNIGPEVQKKQCWQFICVEEKPESAHLSEKVRALNFEKRTTPLPKGASIYINKCSGYEIMKTGRETHDSFVTVPLTAKVVVRIWWGFSWESMCRRKLVEVVPT